VRPGHQFLSRSDSDPCRAVERVALETAEFTRREERPREQRGRANTAAFVEDQHSRVRSCWLSRLSHEPLARPLGRVYGWVPKTAISSVTSEPSVATAIRSAALACTSLRARWWFLETALCDNLRPDRQSGVRASRAGPSTHCVVVLKIRDFAAPGPGHPGPLCRAGRRSPAQHPTRPPAQAGYELARADRDPARARRAHRRRRPHGPKRDPSLNVRTTKPS
jgi:hypothetical protein